MVEEIFLTQLFCDQLFFNPSLRCSKLHPTWIPSHPIPSIFSLCCNIHLRRHYFWTEAPDKARDAATWWRSCNLSTFTLCGDTKARGGWKGGGQWGLWRSTQFVGGCSGRRVGTHMGGGSAGQSQFLWDTKHLAHALREDLEWRAAQVRLRAALPTHVHNTAVPRGLWHLGGNWNRWRTILPRWRGHGPESWIEYLLSIFKHYSMVERKNKIYCPGLRGHQPMHFALLTHVIHS